MENSRAGFQEEGVDRRGWHVDDQLGLHGRPRGVQLRGYRRDRRPAERLRLPQRPMQVLEKNISASLEFWEREGESKKATRKISPRTLIFIFPNKTIYCFSINCNFTSIFNKFLYFTYTINQHN